jgi:hypothetical protein
MFVIKLLPTDDRRAAYLTENHDIELKSKP